MKWSQHAWNSIKPLYGKITELSFISELLDGTLDKEKFIFYIQQDALYLSEYGKVLAGIAAKSNDSKHFAAFIKFAGETMAAENELHQHYIKQYGSGTKLDPSPTCLLYTSYLHTQLASKPFEVALASVLPCFWIYKEVGDYILSQKTVPNNPYKAWIDTYGGDAYAQSVNLAINICDEVASKCSSEQQEKMTEAFIYCSKMEWMFWDSAYKTEKWMI